jgi:hypothetical protein
MPNERYKHIFLAGPSRSQGFTNPRHGGAEPRLKHQDRSQHSAYLKSRFVDAWPETTEEQVRGVKIEFFSEAGFDLVIKSLEDIRSGIRLLNVRQEGEGSNKRTFATVFVPATKRSYFLKKIIAYANESTKKGKPKNANLINSILDIRRAVLESFWTDERQLIPEQDAVWVEVWLSSDKDEVISRFNTALDGLRVPSNEDVLKFPELSVRLIKANKEQLNRLIEMSDDIAELRAAKILASYFIKMENRDQLANVRELITRTVVDQDAEVAVCILDHGINNGHLLIQPVLRDADMHAVIPAWGVSDDDGHGTSMAGIVAYGDLLEVLNNSQRIQIKYCLESAKILPPPPAQNDIRLWGFMTAQGISRAEIQAPMRKRITCLSVASSDDRDRGRPSSWSAKIDELSSGYEDDKRRLIIISGGNVTDSTNWRNYPNDNLTNEIHDPGQAWNALTVGAYTKKTRITDSTLDGFTPVAPSGGLSPYSTTSITWPARKWPIKPEVLFEGGNVAKGPNDSIQQCEDLELLTTYRDPQQAQFTSLNATSAAAAEASRMAAQIQVMYPSAWPETIRGLIVHTAEWTEVMKQQFLQGENYSRLLRICGYGVPNLDYALYCASNSLTLISEATIQPYNKHEGAYKTNEMHLYKLPWPLEVLRDLGETQVQMRITLSYFVEPGPGEVGWDNRYRYPSHALRFALNGAGETETDFVRRINKMAREGGDHPGTRGPGDKWVIGDVRNVGSIHSDIWIGTAADLATSNLIAIYPAVGWWRERHHLNRWNKMTRYSLIVSIRTEEQEVDIYTPVAIQVGITVPIVIRT